MQVWLLSTLALFFQDARDSGGAAIAVFLVREHHPSEASHETVIQDVIFQLDEALKRCAIINHLNLKNRMASGDSFVRRHRHTAFIHTILDSLAEPTQNTRSICLH